MQVNTKVHESQIDKLARGMKAKIRVDAFASEMLDGTVIDVAPLPDSTNFFSSDIKVYTTKVRIDDPLPGLRPGMTAQVEILVDRKENVLTVPVLAILQFNGKDHVTKKVDDRFVADRGRAGRLQREVRRGHEGPQEGDVVAMSPMSLMTEEEKREAFGSAAKGGKKDWGEEGAPTADGKGAADGGAPGAVKKVAGGPGAPARAADPAKAQRARARAAWPRARAAGGRPSSRSSRVSAQEERSQLIDRAPTKKRAELCKKAGLTDAEIEQMAEMREDFGGGGGGFGGGPGGGGRRWRRRSGRRRRRVGRIGTVNEDQSTGQVEPASRSSSWST